jgi:hypothetical protein
MVAGKLQIHASVYQEKPILNMRNSWACRVPRVPVVSVVFQLLLKHCNILQALKLTLIYGRCFRNFAQKTPVCHVAAARRERSTVRLA